MLFSDYVSKHLTKVSAPTSEIASRWQARIVDQGMIGMAPTTCVATYLQRYGKGIGEAKLIALAKAAAYYDRRDIALAFLSEACKQSTDCDPQEEIEIAPAPDPALARPCPVCRAKPGERCKNYNGNFCAPHGARKSEQKADPGERIKTWEGDIAKEAVRQRAQLLPSVEVPMDGMYSERQKGKRETAVIDLPLFQVAEQEPAVQELLLDLAPVRKPALQPDPWPFPVQPGALATMQPVDPQGEEDPAEARLRYIGDDLFWGQPKRDGKRCVVFAMPDRVAYQSRSLALWPSPDPRMDAMLKRAASEFGGFILDGELLYYAVDGSEHRSAPQAATRNIELGAPKAPTTPTYAIFKALFAQGIDLRERDEWIRALQAKVIFEEVLLKYQEGLFELIPYAKTSLEKLDLAQKQSTEGREGEVWIDSTSPYMPGKNYRKVGLNGRAAVYNPPMIRTKYLRDFTLLVTGLAKTGATKVERLFSAIQVASEESGKLVPMGNVGTGFTLEDQRAIKERFESGERLYVDVMSQGLTEAGVLWHPRFVKIASANPE